ncbi:porin [Pseudocolwellia agarivorans]|uniref:porin n=1 Tax=Pseudocolwellia agarivorans TaxID=1911682 RepID=UPI003F881286
MNFFPLKYTSSKVLIPLSFLLSISSTVYAEEDKLEFSGFARVIVGYLDDKNAEYVGYDDSLSINKQSLFALQADYKFNNDFSLTGQVIAHTDDQRQSGLEWLYLTYQPNNSLQVKLGRQRIPFFNYSDSLDVGFAYPWLTLPQQFYDSAFFATFDGILANYEFSINDWLINYEGYWGRFDGTIYTSDSEIDTKAIGLYGANVSVSYENFTVRASYNEGDVSIEQTDVEEFSQQLRQFGFINNADWLNTSGLIQFYHFSVNYENLDYFFRSEVSKLVGGSGLLPDINSFYVSAGYNFAPYTAYISYSKKDLYYKHAINEIPYGLSPGLDMLAGGYDAITTTFADDQSTGIKIGTRWDLKPDLAFKAEITFVEAEDNISNRFGLKDLGGFDGHALLYQIGAEWVF